MKSIVDNNMDTSGKANNWHQQDVNQAAKSHLKVCSFILFQFDRNLFLFLVTWKFSSNIAL